MRSKNKTSIGIIFTGNSVVLPGLSQTVLLSDGPNCGIVERMIENDSLTDTELVGTLPNWLGSGKNAAEDLIGAYGTLVQVEKVFYYNNNDKKLTNLTLYGVARFRVKHIIQEEPFLSVQYVQVEPSVDTMKLVSDNPKLRQLAKKIREESVNVMLATSPRNEKNASAGQKYYQKMMDNIPDESLADLIITFIAPSKSVKLKVLNIVDPLKRLEFAMDVIKDKAEKLKHISKKWDAQKQPAGLTGLLPISNMPPKGDSPEVKDMEKKLKALNLPKDTEKMVMDDFERYKTLPRHVSEYHLLKEYLQLVCKLPWNRSSSDEFSVAEATRILDEDHYSMGQLKKRVLEFIAVSKLNTSNKVANSDGGDQPATTERRAKNPILCLVGPPGVGKTSIAKSIARSLGRKFFRISLGGADDQAAIRGHRRTYVGAASGRIIDALKVTSVNNPVILLDEVDKLGQGGMKGSPASALLEVLDPEQNHTFTDIYLNVPFDLSSCIFICTANNRQNIPRALQDRMEMVTVDGYTSNEKLMIAKKYLLPKQLRLHGITKLLAGDKVSVSVHDEFLHKLIENYTHESGVRSCDRKIAAVCRYIVLEVSKKAEEKACDIVLKTEEDLVKIFGVPDFSSTKKQEITRSGFVNGLYATLVGGGITHIEVERFMCSDDKKGGEFQVTGMLGDVLKESVQIAATYLRSQLLPQLKDYKDDFDHYTYHIHLPEGATRKDGPSAGIALATALFSKATNKLVDSDVAMTGELSLRGRVLPIGGIKEKVLAAHRNGFTKVILPKANEGKAKSVLPKELQDSLKIYYVEYVEEVLEIAIHGITLQDFPVSYLAHCTGKL